MIQPTPRSIREWEREAAASAMRSARRRLYREQTRDEWLYTAGIVAYALLVFAIAFLMIWELA